MTSEFTHLDDDGNARMVNVGGKEVTSREAEAEATVRMSAEAFRRLQEGTVEKGNVLAVARLAGIQAAKRTADLIPLCHQVPLDAVEVTFLPEEGSRCVRIRAVARARWATGVEMEALTAVSVAALALYDMCKAIDRGITVESIRLLRKSGGRSGAWARA